MDLQFTIELIIYSCVWPWLAQVCNLQLKTAFVFFRHKFENLRQSDDLTPDPSPHGEGRRPRL